MTSLHKPEGPKSNELTIHGTGDQFGGRNFATLTCGQVVSVTHARGIAGKSNPRLAALVTDDIEVLILCWRLKVRSDSFELSLCGPRTAGRQVFTPILELAFAQAI